MSALAGGAADRIRHEWLRLLFAAALATGLGWSDLPGARGQDLDQARALYDQGVMLKAARLARGFGTADGHALASQSTLVAAIYLQPGGHDRVLLEQSAQDAQRALEIDPDHVQAHLQLALALGYLAEEDPIVAHLDGTAHEGRALLERALALAPDDAWAHGMLGVWHLRVVKHAGGLLAASLYDASIEKGREQCIEAASLAPDGLAIRFGCAISLLEADPKRYGGEAADILDTVVRLPAGDAATRLIRDEARHRLAALKSGLED
jgi:hypothetical protein